MTFNKGTHQAKTKIETLKIRLVGKIVIKILKFNTLTISQRWMSWVVFFYLKVNYISRNARYSV